MRGDIGVPGVAGAEQIGQGAFGKVYRAEESDLNRTVAVKVLANVDLDEETRARFAREARAIGRLSGHPNIVDVYAQGSTADGVPYLLMEFCSKGSLGDRLSNGARLSWQEATEMIVEICGALETAHAAGILHRDIKPANILIDGYGTPKLADFGIARMGPDDSVTATGMLTGSPAHMAPELIAGADPTPVSDVYSLGSTLFALMTGQPPFVRTSDTSILSLLHRIAAEPAPHLTQWGVPAPIADLVAAALAKDPAMRPPSCAEFARALRAARTQLGLAPGKYTGPADAAGRTPVVDATIIPDRAVHRPAANPPHPVSLAGPHASFGAPIPPAGPPSQSVTHHDDGDSRRKVIMVAAWAVVAICLALIALVLVDRSQRLSAAVALAAWLP